MLREFRDFLFRGNIVELAVAFVRTRDLPAEHGGAHGSGQRSHDGCAADGEEGATPASVSGVGGRASGHRTGTSKVTVEACPRRTAVTSSRHRPPGVSETP